MDTPSLLSAVDTCVLMDLAEHSRPAWQAVRQLRSHGICFVIPPTATAELAHTAHVCPEFERQRLAGVAAKTIGKPPLQDFTFATLTREQIVEIKTVAARLRRESLLPYEERHDHQIICEAAMLGCAYLLTDDTHLLGAPNNASPPCFSKWD